MSIDGEEEVGKKEPNLPPQIARHLKVLQDPWSKAEIPRNTAWARTFLISIARTTAAVVRRRGTFWSLAQVQQKRGLLCGHGSAYPMKQTVFEKMDCSLSNQFRVGGEKRFPARVLVPLAKEGWPPLRRTGWFVWITTIILPRDVDLVGIT